MMGAHIAYVCNMGFEFAKVYCNDKGIPYEYIALVDADNILEARAKHRGYEIGNKYAECFEVLRLMGEI